MIIMYGYYVYIIPKTAEPWERRRRWLNEFYTLQVVHQDVAIAKALKIYNFSHPNDHLLPKECWYLLVPRIPTVRRPVPINADDGRLLYKIMHTDYLIRN
ncbi:MAG: hypothetical protein ABF743_06615 [Schleiferilactobacillus perolens]